MSRRSTSCPRSRSPSMAGHTGRRAGRRPFRGRGADCLIRPAKRAVRKDVSMSTQQSADPSTFDDGEWYDVMCQGLDYGIDFYAGLAREAKGPVLEIACGTGRILLRCAQAGVDIDGLD